MMPTTIGDLAQTFLNRRADTRLSQQLSNLSTELTTGLASDPVAALRGDTSGLAALDRGLALIDAYDLATKEARLIADATQTTMSNLRERVDSLLPKLSAVAGGSVAVGAVASEARGAFLGFAADLNTHVAGQSLFAGTAATGPAIRDGSQILGDLVASLAGAASAQDVIDGIDAYFGPGGGFETTDYLGDPVSRDAFRLGADDRIALGTRADDPGIVEGLKVLARLAVLDMGVLATDPKERNALALGSVDATLSAGRSLIGVSAEVGSAQFRIEQSAARNAGERTALEAARLDLLAIDPYEAATRLRQTEGQIETLYTLTARLSRLTLTAYL